MSISKPLIESILLRDLEYSYDCLAAQISAKDNVKKKRQELVTKAASNTLHQHLAESSI